MADDDSPARSAEVNLDGSIGHQYHDPIEREDSEPQSRRSRLGWFLRVQSLRIGVVARTIARVAALALIVQGLWNHFLHSFFAAGPVAPAQRQAIGSLVGADAGSTLLIADVLLAAIGLFLFRRI